MPYSNDLRVAPSDGSAGVELREISAGSHCPYGDRSRPDDSNAAFMPPLTTRDDDAGGLEGVTRVLVLPPPATDAASGGSCDAALAAALPWLERHFAAWLQRRSRGGRTAVAERYEAHVCAFAPPPARTWRTAFLRFGAAEARAQAARACDDACGRFAALLSARLDAAAARHNASGVRAGAELPTPGAGTLFAVASGVNATAAAWGPFVSATVLALKPAVVFVADGTAAAVAAASGRASQQRWRATETEGVVRALAGHVDVAWCREIVTAENVAIAAPGSVACCINLDRIHPYLPPAVVSALRFTRGPMDGAPDASNVAGAASGSGNVPLALFAMYSTHGDAVIGGADGGGGTHDWFERIRERKTCTDRCLADTKALVHRMYGASVAVNAVATAETSLVAGLRSAVEPASTSGMPQPLPGGVAAISVGAAGTRRAQAPGASRWDVFAASARLALRMRGSHAESVARAFPYTTILVAHAAE